ncbi:MAG: isopenicillin N synthase family oxygenase [Proteobacteria bacterium]|nr:isopenicillin N synthase family oxygenase [Pseudomonadota bacterium]
MKKIDEFTSIPVIDIAALRDQKAKHQGVAQEIRQAASESGFFYIVGHGVDPQLQENLEKLSRTLKIRMAFGGRAWRGYFPVGSELTSGRPDLKEGLYFGAELSPQHPEVLAGTPLHGANLFPSLQGFRETVLSYIEALTELGHVLMRGISLSLGLEANFFDDKYTRDPLVLFRIFHYPPDQNNGNSTQWGVGEHTDYGLLTILRQDDVGGLQVKSRSQWIEAPPLKNSFVCNIGDMLDRMTGGLYRSTPHRVKNTTNRQRYSFPFFFDPGFRAEVKPILLNQPKSDDQAERWD